MYRLEYLPLAETDILEIDVYLHEHSSSAADKFADSIENLSETLLCHPFMFPIYEESPYFRHITLPYKYRLFYYVDEDAKVIRIYRILHGMRDVKSIMESEGYS